MSGQKTMNCLILNFFFLIMCHHVSKPIFSFTPAIPILYVTDAFFSLWLQYCVKIHETPRAVILSAAKNLTWRKRILSAAKNDSPGERTTTTHNHNTPSFTR